MKGPSVNFELEGIATVLNQLGGKIEKNIEIFENNLDISRVLILVKKTKKTEDKFPRRVGIPEKKPLG